MEFFLLYNLEWKVLYNNQVNKSLLDNFLI